MTTPMGDRQVHYRQHDQRELDFQYTNRRRFPDYDDHFGRWRAGVSSSAAHLYLAHLKGLLNG